MSNKTPADRSPSETTTRRRTISITALTGIVSGAVRAAIDWIVEHLQSQP